MEERLASVMDVPQRDTIRSLLATGERRGWIMAK